jgi:2'-5' RNA ligase
MRLFIAFNFDEKDKNHIYENVLRLKNVTQKASFTNKENLHLTLVFIGETTKQSLIETIIEQSIEQTMAKTMLIQIGGFGVFKRREGDICWIGVQKSKELVKLYEVLSNNLRKADFPIEEREFRPHLTLARRTLFKAVFNVKQFESETVSSEIQINKVSLMKSERINGKLVYTEVYHCDFKI